MPQFKIIDLHVDSSDYDGELANKAYDFIESNSDWNEQSIGWAIRCSYAAIATEGEQIVGVAMSNGTSEHDCFGLHTDELSAALTGWLAEVA